MSRPPLIERAYQLARSGVFADVFAIQTALQREGYTDSRAHLSGASARKELSRLCREARRAPDVAKPEPLEVATAPQEPRP